MTTMIAQMRFDPDQFAKNFFWKVAKAKRSVRDVFFLNTIFMWHKGRQDRVKFRLSFEADELVEYLTSIYEIEADGNDELQDDIVTLERIHFAFPVIGCKVAAVGAEQRKASSQLNRFMAIIECPAFARYCSTLLEFGEQEGSLFVDAYCWGQYLNACKTSCEVEPCAVSIRDKALRWKSNFSLDELVDVFRLKLGMFKGIDEMMADESNIRLGIAELHRNLRSAACIPNVTFIVDTAIYERPIAMKFEFEADETFLNKYEVLHFSGALLCYLTLIKKRLCRDNKASNRTFKEKENLPELRTTLKEAAVAVLKSTPDRIVQLMRVVGLRVSWGSLVHAAHVRVRPLIRNVLAVNPPARMTRSDMARLGLQIMFTQSKIFKGCYPNLIREWAVKWRRLYVDRES